MEPRLRVLLVDDDHNDLALFGIAVERTDLDIWLQTVRDGQEAIDLLQGNGIYADRAMHPLPDLVVLDLKMPRLNGFEFLAWRKASAKFCSLPVVIFASADYPGELEMAKLLGAEACVEKPNEFEDWKRVVRKVWDLAMERGLLRPAA